MRCAPHSRPVVSPDEFGHMLARRNTSRHRTSPFVPPSRVTSCAAKFNARASRSGHRCIPTALNVAFVVHVAKDRKDKKKHAPHWKGVQNLERLGTSTIPPFQPTKCHNAAPSFMHARKETSSSVAAQPRHAGQRASNIGRSRCGQIRTET